MTTKMSVKAKRDAKKPTKTRRSSRSKEIVISKDEVIKALETEPLRAGSWAERPTLRKVGDCNVCAVGAVLRGAGLTNRELSEWAHVRVYQPSPTHSSTTYEIAMNEALGLIENDLPLSALSTLFENLAYDYESLAGGPRKVTKAIRKRLISFVKKHFPDELRLPRNAESSLKSASFPDRF